MVELSGKKNKFYGQLNRINFLWLQGWLQQKNQQQDNDKYRTNRKIYTAGSLFFKLFFYRTDFFSQCFFFWWFHIGKIHFLDFC